MTLATATDSGTGGNGLGGGDASNGKGANGDDEGSGGKGGCDENSGSGGSTVTAITACRDDAGDSDAAGCTSAHGSATTLRNGGSLNSPLLSLQLAGRSKGVSSVARQQGEDSSKLQAKLPLQVNTLILSSPTYAHARKPTH
eukprot:3068547-Pleurochrysis_carterae.AAC.1